MPLDAIIFGGRRRTAIPLVVESRDWQHGVFLAATLSSETTAAATGAVGVVRRDPMAMLPFLGYNVGDYFAHWIDMGKCGRRDQDAAHLLRELVPHARAEGKFLWPGFGENVRVIKWALERIDRHRDRGRHRDRPGADARVARLDRPRHQPPSSSKRRSRSSRPSGATRSPASRSGSPRSATRCPSSMHDELDSLKLRLGL